MLKNNIYNIDKEFDYGTIKAFVVKSLEKIAKEATLKNASDVLFDSKDNDDHPVNMNRSLSDVTDSNFFPTRISLPV
jgi:hypothetical protein